MDLIGKAFIVFFQVC